MSERNLWLELSSRLSGQWHASRVESHATSAGIPDVDYCFLGGEEGHLELKYGKYKKLSSKSKMPEIRGTQVRWCNNRVRAGGTVILITKLVEGDVDIYFLHDGSKIEQLSDCREYWFWLKEAKCRDNYMSDKIIAAIKHWKEYYVK